MNDNFRKLHVSKYGHELDAPTETVNFRLKAMGKIKDVKMEEVPEGKLSKEAMREKRRVFLDNSFIECPIFTRSKLMHGYHIEGPAIIEEPTHTTVISSTESIDVDRYGNLIIHIGGVR